MSKEKKLSEVRSPGRPRSAEVEIKILATVLGELAENGYSRMSLDVIAVKAGVSKPTMYRRWSSKADIATAALRTLQIAEPAVDSGSTPKDIALALRNFCRSLTRPNGMSLIGTVLAEEAHTPELLQLFRERIVKPRRALLAEILKRGEAKKLLRPGVNLETVVNLMVGAFYARYLATSVVPESFADEVADLVWRGIKAG